MASESTKADGGGSLAGASLASPGVSMPGLQPSPPGDNSLPSTWSGYTLSGDTHLCQFVLGKTSWEFQSILAEFGRVGMTVKKIERVENSDLWEKFVFERRRMEKSTAEINEVYLYHGSSADKEQICMEGLDQRLSRIGFFGRGIYFSDNPLKCLSYSGAKAEGLLQNLCTVYKCRVLLGNMKVYADGQQAKELRREPLIENPEPGGATYYDSVKGCIKDYDEFILYKSERVLPEYVISCFLPPKSTSSSQDGTAVPETVQTVGEQGAGTAKTEEGSKADGVKGQAQGVKGQADGVKGQADGVKGQGQGVRGQLVGASGHVWEYDNEEEISAELAAGALQRPAPSAGACSSTTAHDEEVSQELRKVRQRESNGSAGAEGRKGEPEEEACVEIRKQDKLSTELRQREVTGSVFEESGRRGEPEEEACVEIKKQDELSTELRQMDLTGTQQPAGNRYLPPHLRYSSRAVHQTDATSCGPPPTNKASGATVEPISTESLPSVLRVREEVWMDRLLDGESEGRTSGAGRQRAPSAASGGIPKNRGDRETVRDFEEQRKGMQQNPHTYRRADGWESQRLMPRGSRPTQPQVIKPVTSHPPVSANPRRFQSARPVQDAEGKKLKKLIDQFMDVTACEDRKEAKRYVLLAKEDVNQAIIHYLNS